MFEYKHNKTILFEYGTHFIKQCVSSECSEGDVCIHLGPVVQNLGCH